jgi:hypothetical protein
MSRAKKGVHPAPKGACPTHAPDSVIGQAFFSFSISALNSGSVRTTKISAVPMPTIPNIMPNRSNIEVPVGIQFLANMFTNRDGKKHAAKNDANTGGL